MIKKIALLLLLSSFISTTYGQKSASDYSYIVVPELFEFLFEEDQHQLNSMTKFLFNKYGFNAYFPSELPNVKRCDGLQAEVLGKPGFVYTRITVIIKDCYGEEIHRSEEGQSKYKEYKKAYQDALRKAFTSIEGLGVRQKEVVAYEDDLSTYDEVNDETAKKSSGTDAKISVLGMTNFPGSKFTSYELGGKSYLLRKTMEGYSFYEESEDAPNGLLLKGVIVIKEDKAIYTSTEGVEHNAGFMESGDFILESAGSIIRYNAAN